MGLLTVKTYWVGGLRVGTGVDQVLGFTAMAASRTTTTVFLRMAETKATVTLYGGPDAWFDFENHVENRDDRWDFWGNKF